MPKNLIIAIFFLSTISLFGQSDNELLTLYKNVIEKSDSLQAVGKIDKMNIKNVYADAKIADKQYPEMYFKKALEYFKKESYNESAFLYYLGKMRTEDLNNLGKEYYSPREEYNTVLEEGNFLYLSINTDNFVKILKLATDYYKSNNYQYISKTKGYQKLSDPKSYSKLIEEMISNKAETQAKLTDNRTEMIKRIQPYFQMLK